MLVLLVGSACKKDAPRQRPTGPLVDVCEGKPGVKLVTMGVGSLIWERHGHIALCTCGDGGRRDACYNYGIGDFAKPLEMASGFFRAAKSFWVGKMDPRQMIAVYQYADRTVWVQDLPLTPEQEDFVIKKLEFDILEENKHYSYDHFWDNCTTRVRDIIDDATKGALSSMTNLTDDRTYRDLAREGFLGMRIPLLITDIAMGRVTDRVPTYWERMFLPDYLREAVEARWGVKPVVLYQRKGPPSLKELEKALADPTLTPERRRDLEAQLEAIKNVPTGRVLFCLFVILLTAPAWLTRKWGRFERTGLAVAVVPAAFLGLIFWALAVISPLPYVRWQETLLCLMPFDLLLLFLPPDKRRIYARGRTIMLGLVAALLLVGVLKQPIWPAWLWALIPNAVVGFWPERWTPVTAVSADNASGAGEVKRKPRKR
ncbi:MAG: hypothetical protein JWP01_1162 [Myxococcales bacterium]|nr:hypothetical protein [Myxococcales bacterium]